MSTKIHNNPEALKFRENLEEIFPCASSRLCLYYIVRKGLRISMKSSSFLHISILSDIFSIFRSWELYIFRKYMSTDQDHLQLLVSGTRRCT